MIGLTQYARDLTLPARFGEPGLVPPSEEEMVALVNERLRGSIRDVDGSGRAEGARVVHVRYKPAVAVAATYAVSMSSGAEHAVTYKAHLGHKAGDREAGGRYAHKLAGACAPLKPFALLPERRASLWVFPGDPELRGAVRALDMHRTARWIDRLCVVEPWTVRLRPSVLTLRRYKHSRRAVFHVLAKLRGKGGARGAREFGLRVVPPESATRSVERRMGLDSYDLPIPKCLGHDSVAGWILEEWLPGNAAERDDLSVAPHALRCAARIHRAPTGGGSATVIAKRLAPVELLRGVAGVEDLPRSLFQSTDVPVTCWIHGDLHPDQVLLQDGGASLLDLDDLRLGAVEEDLASWAADALALGAGGAGGAADAGSVFAELLDLYGGAGGAPVDRKLLRRLTGLELLERAAGSVRRLEVNALTHAAHLASLANSIAGEGL